MKHFAARAPCEVFHPVGGGSGLDLRVRPAAASLEGWEKVSYEDRELEGAKTRKSK